MPVAKDKVEGVRAGTARKPVRRDPTPPPPIPKLPSPPKLGGLKPPTLPPGLGKPPASTPLGDRIAAIQAKNKASSARVDASDEALNAVDGPAAKKRGVVAAPAPVAGPDAVLAAVADDRAAAGSSGDDAEDSVPGFRADALTGSVQETPAPGAAALPDDLGTEPVGPASIPPGTELVPPAMPTAGFRILGLDRNKLYVGGAIAAVLLLLIIVVFASGDDDGGGWRSPGVGGEGQGRGFCRGRHGSRGRRRRSGYQRRGPGR